MVKRINAPVIINGVSDTENVPIYNIHNFPYPNEITYPVVGTSSKKKPRYYNVSCAFDIETSLINVNNDDYKNGKRPYAFMYIWQICINNDVCMGRTWDEFVYFLEELSVSLALTDNKRLCIYVHNLAYEFMFMHNFVKINSMFAKGKRKPLYFSTSLGIEFRCSYFLSNMSLAKFCENSKLCTFQKAKGDLDYKIVRTPETVLSDTELGYCYNDVRGLCQCIDTLLEFDTIATMPLTSTGFVRRDCRIAVQENSENRKLFTYCALTPRLYELLKQAFRGGDTHANRAHSGKILENIYSFDIQSSYPAWLLLEKYPVTPFIELKADNVSRETFRKLINEKACLMTISFQDLKIKRDKPNPYVPISKCLERYDVISDNGRVLSASYIKMSMTDIDFKIIEDCYTFTSFRIDEIFTSEYGYLNMELRKEIIHYYELKTKLKNVPGLEYEYMKSKNKINAIFGMMVSDISHDEYIFNDDTGEWDVEQADLAESLNKYYTSRNNFLSYQHGVWNTAHARKHLNGMISKVGMDSVYWDTDSLKFMDEKNKEFFFMENQKIMDMIFNCDVNAWAEDKNGRKMYLGIWDDEGEGEIYYSRFKTLGAKKYVYNYYKDGKFAITVAGISKKLGAKKIGKIENFYLGATWDNVGRTTAYYHEEDVHYITVNGYNIKTASNVGIVDTTYELGVTSEYWDLIGENILEETS